MAEKIQREVSLEIEQDRGESGVVHQAMFKAAYEADLYIADLTGANANVFFELGVRLSLRRSVTVLTSQENKTLFNINSLRVVRYADRPDAYCVKEIVEMLAYGLAHPDHCDSPILDLLKLHVDDRDRWMRLSGQRVRTLLEAAEQCHDPEIALEYVQQAVKDDIFSIEARLALAKTFRQRQDYGSALSAIGKAKAIDSEVDIVNGGDENSRYWKLFDLGDMMIISGESNEALGVYQRAIDLVPRNSRAEVLLSPIRAWRELLEACKLKQEVCNVAHNVLEILEQARQ